MNKQTASTLLMIRPANFGFNEQTAESNAFQQQSQTDTDTIQNKALQEFDNYVAVLKENDVNVVVLKDTEEPVKPDSVFPNNWVTFHESGNVYMYPMQAENRRLERREDVIRKLEDCFTVKHIIDISRFELQHKFLEGTGSMVLDRENKIIYACLSPRTNEEVLKTFADSEGYKYITFNAADETGKPIYHTNVLMCLGEKFAVICMESINNEAERAALKSSFEKTGKEIIEISFDQMKHYAGNMLEVENEKGDKLLIMSQQAYNSLDEEQKRKLQQYCKLVFTDLSTIEKHGGGSARCMLAEVYLPVGSSN